MCIVPLASCDENHQLERKGREQREELGLYIYIYKKIKNKVHLQVVRGGEGGRALYYFDFDCIVAPCCRVWRCVQTSFTADWVLQVTTVHTHTQAQALACSKFIQSHNMLLPLLLFQGVQFFQSEGTCVQAIGGYTNTVQSCWDGPALCVYKYRALTEAHSVPVC